MPEHRVKSFFAWLAPFFGLALILSGLAFLSSGDLSVSDLDSAGSFYKSSSFSTVFDEIARSAAVSLSGYGSDTYASCPADDGGTLLRSSYLDSLGDIVYFARNKAPGSPVYSNGSYSLFTSYNASVYAGDYRFVLSFNAGSLTMYLDGEEFHSYRLQNLLFSAFSLYDLDTADITFFLAVEPIMAYPEFDGELLDCYTRWRARSLIFVLSVVLILAGAALTLLSWLIPRLRSLRRAFSERVLACLAHILLEGKLALACVCLYGMARVFAWISDYGMRPGHLPLLLCCEGAVIVLVYLLLDLVHEGRGVLDCSVGGLVRRAFREFRSRTPLERRAARDLACFLLAECSLLLLACLFLCVSVLNRYGALQGFLLCALPVAAAVLVLRRFLRGQHDLMHDLELLRESIERLTRGEYEGDLPLPEPSHDLYPLAEGLRHLRDGLSDAVDARVRSERMKAELVTNVSHDLKTPLTSIISYSRLLDDLHLEEPAGGYVRILCEKSDRLARLTRDLFEVSRAQSGNLPVSLARLDLKAHLEQTLAELSERIGSSGLTFRVRLPDSPVWIDCDGERLYRVLENLVANALAYSLAGTRVYIDLSVDGTLSIRNVAAYEMTFTADEISERFVRGDASRTDGGTGLGLSIARSFTEAVGGRFSIDIDGDVFRVTLAFTPKDAPENTDEKGENDSCTVSADSPV